MRIFRLLSVSMLAMSFGAFGAQAQNLRGDSGPAEIPPASFTGKQYVDSRGCVYIRAGFSGKVNWIPRVTRSRKLICGQTPSLKTPSRTAKAAPKPKTKKVVRKAKPSAIPAGAKVVKKTTTIVPAPKKAKTRVVRKVAPTPKPQVKVVRKQVSPKRAVAAPKKQVVRRCGASDFSSQFINDGARCGPQNKKARGEIRQEISPQSRNSAKTGQKIGAKTVVRRVASAKTTTPKGYKAAWNDDRLNPLRGVGTSSGEASMQLVWSNTVPRYLIDPATGKRATR